MQLVMFIAVLMGLGATQTIRAAPTVRAAALSPVILFPGDGGSQIEAELNKTSAHLWCTRTSPWYSLWLDLKDFLPGFIKCFVDNMKLQYDPVTRTTRNQPGVNTRVPGFGNTNTVEYMDPSENSFTIYYFTLVDYLVKTMGYKRGVSIRGAPYDFRKAPNEMGDYIANVKRLVEETYARNGNRRVVLLGHSMGTLYVLYMLNHQTQAWKDKYVRAFISVGGPYGGAVKSMKMFASGYNLNVVGLDQVTMREQQRTMPSSSFLLPYDTFWAPHEVLISAPTGNYTVANYSQFFTDIGYPDGMEMRKDTEPLIKDLTPPGVQLHCLYGIDVPTAESYLYTPVRIGSSSWYDWQPHEVRYGAGDGTVNLRSLLGCQRWAGQQTQPVLHQEFSGMDHLKMLRHEEFVNYVGKVLQVLQV